nr:MAG TPA: hypothetical protein [Caudoviricetes sp.]
MNKLTYVQEKDLLVLAMPATQIKKETKDRLALELKEKTGIKNVLVTEGEFEVCGSVDYSETEDFTAGYTSDGDQYVFQNN